MSTEKKQWQEYSKTLKEVLNLDFSPVALICTKDPKIKPSEKKVRICRAILEAGKGASICLNKENNACFGASWHLGFQSLKNPRNNQNQST